MWYSLTMNQCDGCLSKRPLVTYHQAWGGWFLDPNGKTHIMGPVQMEPTGEVIPVGYPDLMGCERHKYMESK